MLSWGILGTGPISDTMAAAIGQSDGSRIQAVFGRDPRRAARFQSRYAIPRAVSSQGDLLADPSVDIVYVGLPNALHREACVAAARAGKHILCEKSLAVDRVGSDAVLDEVERAGVFFAEGLMYLSHPVTKRLVDLLRDGRLGALKAISGLYAADIWRLVNPAGGGVLYNLGCYPVSLLHLVIQSLLGPEAFADRATAGHGTVGGHDGFVGEAAIAARFPGGVLATLQTAETYGMAWRFDILGQNGALRYVTNPWLPPAAANELVWSPYGGPDERIVVAADQDAFYHQVRMAERAVSAGLREAPRPAPRPSDSREIMAFLTEWEDLVRGGTA